MKLPKPASLAVIALLFTLAACDTNLQPTPTPTTLPLTATTPTTPDVTPAPPTLAPTLTTAATSTPLPQPPTPTQEIPPTSTTQPTTSPHTTTTTNLTGCPSQAKQDGVGDPLYPQLGNSGYNVQHYTLDLSVDVNSNTISGTTTIQAQATQSLSSFNLDFQGLTISSLTLNNNKAVYTRTGHELTITPDKPLKQGEKLTIVVAYSGVPETARSKDLPVTPGWAKYDKGIYVANEPAGAATWYPVNDHPCDKATYTMRITVPRPYSVAANGLLQSATDNGNTTTYLWEEVHPMASYLVTVNIAEFDLETAHTPAGLLIRNYFPKSIPRSTRDAFKRTSDMIEYFSTLWGAYPFEAYGVVIADTDLGFALETQSLSLFSAHVGGAKTEAEEVVAHELSHQWFGDSVSLQSWKDLWLNEGFATYAQWLWLEHNDGRAAYNARISTMHDYLSATKPPPPGNPPANDLFNPGVYLRGGLTLHALRQRVGDDTFFRIMKTYATRYKYGNATTQDFITVSEEVSGQKLGDLFNAWLYNKDIPSLP